MSFEAIRDRLTLMRAYVRDVETLLKAIDERPEVTLPISAADVIAMVPRKGNKPPNGEYLIDDDDLPTRYQTEGRDGPPPPFEPVGPTLEVSK